MTAHPNMQQVAVNVQTVLHANSHSVPFDHYRGPHTLPMLTPAIVPNQVVLPYRDGGEGRPLYLGGNFVMTDRTGAGIPHPVRWLADGPVHVGGVSRGPYSINSVVVDGNLEGGLRSGLDLHSDLIPVVRPARFEGRGPDRYWPLLHEFGRTNNWNGAAAAAALPIVPAVRYCIPFDKVYGVKVNVQVGGYYLRCVYRHAFRTVMAEESSDGIIEQGIMQAYIYFPHFVVLLHTPLPGTVVEFQKALDVLSDKLGRNGWQHIERVPYRRTAQEVYLDGDMYDSDGVPLSLADTIDVAFPLGLDVLDYDAAMNSLPDGWNTGMVEMTRRMRKRMAKLAGGKFLPVPADLVGFIHN